MRSDRATFDHASMRSRRIQFQPCEFLNVWETLVTPLKWPEVLRKRPRRIAPVTSSRSREVSKEVGETRQRLVFRTIVSEAGVTLESIVARGWKGLT